MSKRSFVVDTYTYGGPEACTSCSCCSTSSEHYCQTSSTSTLSSMVAAKESTEMPTAENLAPKFSFNLRDDLDSSFLPARAEPTATGWDLKAALEPGQEEIVLQPFGRALINTGVRMCAPDGWWLRLVARSSTFTKRNLHLHIGTIDTSYTGWCYLAVQYIPSNPVPGECIGGDNPGAPPLVIKKGDTLGQFIPFRLEEMEVVQVSNEEFEHLTTEKRKIRGDGGFGSTTAKEFK
jgi:dUTPase